VVGFSGVEKVFRETFQVFVRFGVLVNEERRAAFRY
jgi:hypothetical protein